MSFQAPPKPITFTGDKNSLVVIRNLKATDILFLLTPVVIPVNNDPRDTTDPFECFGKALQRHHNRIRHAPYRTINGITGTHISIMRSATVVVFVMTELPRPFSSQVQAALDTRKALRDGQSLLIIITCAAQGHEQFKEVFPAIIQCKNYTRSVLESTASFIFKTWQVERWVESRDIHGVCDLWTQNIDGRFAMHHTTLAALLDRPGYAAHYVVRDPSERILGFCATFLSFVDRGEEELIACLAILLVDSGHRHQGIGLSLHDYAMDRLKIRGVSQLQLGSTFPRILYGPLFNTGFDKRWFSGRGWQLDMEYPGQGQLVYDMILDFDAWDYKLPENGPNFAECRESDMDQILALVEGDVARQRKIGWFDQYSKLKRNINMQDIVVVIELGAIAGVALTYKPSSSSPISSDLPWAGVIGNDIGGVTCICTAKDRRDMLMIPLLNECIEKFRTQGFKKLFLDAVTNDDVLNFKKIGFKEWACYRDIRRWVKSESYPGVNP